MKIGWDQYEAYTRQLISKIRADGFLPDVVVGVGNSGLIPATMVSKGLELTDLQTITISSYDGKNRGAVKLTADHLSDLTGKSVLCVDDIVASGKTLELAYEVIQKHGASEIRSAAPVVSEFVCKVYPNYWGESILRAEGDFIFLPWDEEV